MLWASVTSEPCLIVSVCLPSVCLCFCPVLLLLLPQEHSSAELFVTHGASLSVQDPTRPPFPLSKAELARVLPEGICHGAVGTQVVLDFQPEKPVGAACGR